MTQAQIDAAVTLGHDIATTIDAVSLGENIVEVNKALQSMKFKLEVRKFIVD